MSEFKTTPGNYTTADAVRRADSVIWKVYKADSRKCSSHVMTDSTRYCVTYEDTSAYNRDSFIRVDGCLGVVLLKSNLRVINVYVGKANSFDELDKYGMGGLKNKNSGSAMHFNAVGLEVDSSMRGNHTASLSIERTIPFTILHVYRPNTPTMLIVIDEKFANNKDLRELAYTIQGLFNCNTECIAMVYTDSTAGFMFYRIGELTESETAFHDKHCVGEYEKNPHVSRNVFYMLNCDSDEPCDSVVFY